MSANTVDSVCPLLTPRVCVSPYIITKDTPNACPVFCTAMSSDTSKYEKRVIVTLRESPTVVAPEGYRSPASGIQPTSFAWSKGTFYRRGAQCCLYKDSKVYSFDCLVDRESLLSTAPAPAC